MAGSLDRYASSVARKVASASTGSGFGRAWPASASSTGGISNGAFVDGRDALAYDPRVVDGSLEISLRAFFDTRPECLVAYLFGSHARGEARPGSDVDVAVLFAEPRPVGLASLPVEIEDELTRLLGRPVDVVALNEAPADLVHRVLRDGVLVCERDRSARVRFEVRLRNEYFDLAPILARYRRSARVGP